jgi:hypothetical protein
MVTGSVAIDVAIGLTLLYMLLSAGASALYELGSQLLTKKRGRMLMNHLESVFKGEDEASKAKGEELFKLFRAHPLIASLRQGGDPSRNPAYIAPATFVSALLDVVVPAGREMARAPRTLDDIRAALAAAPSGAVQRSLLALLSGAQDDMALFQKKVEDWYADIGDRMSGWYKRHAQVALLMIGIVAAGALNADTLMVARVLATNPSIRQTVLDAAQAKARAPGAAPAQSPTTTTDITPVVKELQANLDKAGLPIWWSQDQNSPNRLPLCTGEWTGKVLGILITAVAVSLGASFWFDLMSKIVNLRASGPKPKKSDQEAK